MTVDTALQALILKLANQTILVVGDVILDEYIIGQATRMSREAPIPILEYQERRYIAGGASNPSANIVALGSRAIQIGLVGEDDSARQLKAVLEAKNIDKSGLIACSDRPTTVKARLMAQMGLRFPQQIARIDTLSREPISNAIEAQLLEKTTDTVERCSAILVSDYNGGMLTSSFVESLRNLANQHDKLICVDAQGQFEKYQGFDVVKCNADDAQAFLRRNLASDADFAQAAQDLLANLNIKQAMIVTRGSHGATVATALGVHHCPSPHISDVFDTVGAGDTAIAVITLGLAVGLTPRDAVMLANYASGIVVRHLGNYTPSPTELSDAIQRGLNRKP